MAEGNVQERRKSLDRGRLSLIIRQTPATGGIQEGEAVREGSPWLALKLEDTV